jgi:hypothetical protein
MQVGSFDPINPREELAGLRERVLQLEERLKQAYIDLSHKEVELRQIRKERDDLKVKLEVAKNDLEHVQDLLNQSNQKTARKRKGGVRLTIAANVVFFVAAVMASVAANYFTAAPPNGAGVIIAGAIALGTYAAGSVITSVLASGE